MRPVALAVERLTVMYPGASVPALDDVSFRAARGEMVALVGVNGAGKTTAVNAMLGIIEPHGGRVEIDRLELASLPARDRLAHFGLLTQEFGRYELTVREAVALGTRVPVDDDAIWAALVVAGADRLVEALPDGLDTMLGQQWGGVGLSGGQWQRIALARIAVRDAGIWILDEPTSSVDAEAEVEIFDRLRRTGADRITVVVSHRAWTLRDMDRIYVFNEGRVVQHGRYEELIAQPGRFAEIFAEQV
jgi:ATP-binding cassette subfamily B protein